MLTAAIKQFNNNCRAWDHRNFSTSSNRDSEATDMSETPTETPNRDSNRNFSTSSNKDSEATDMSETPKETPNRDSNRDSNLLKLRLWSHWHVRDSKRDSKQRLQQRLQPPQTETLKPLTWQRLQKRLQTETPTETFQPPQTGTLKPLTCQRLQTETLKTLTCRLHLQWLRSRFACPPSSNWFFSGTLFLGKLTLKTTKSKQG